jgi:hypothetical protein
MIWLSVPIAVCVWTYLVRRRNLITRIGRLLHVAWLLAMLSWHHTRHHVRNAWYLAGDFTCWVWLYFGGTLRRASRPAVDPPELTAAIQAHPASRGRSQDPLDGPFTAWEADHQKWRLEAGQDA